MEDCMTLYFETVEDFPEAGNRNVYYVAKRSGLVYTYERSHYIKVPIGAECYVSPNYPGDPPPKPVFELEFDAQGGAPVPDKIQAVAGSEIEKPVPDPTLEGYTFLGWFDAPIDGTAVAWPYILRKNTTFYAYWDAE
jgi:uncharacterized repeat protein (TIGR02543 family)